MSTGPITVDIPLILRLLPVWALWGSNPGPPACRARLGRYALGARGYETGAVEPFSADCPRRSARPDCACAQLDCCQQCCHQGAGR